MSPARARVLLLALLAIPLLAAAEPEGWAYELWNELMSPFCPGRTLADCPSDRADSLRLWILMQEASGRSREEVEGELIERYGDVVLSAPRVRGFGIAAYAIPLAAFLGGGALVLWFLRRRTRGADPARRAPVADPELERVVDEELAQ